MNGFAAHAAGVTTAALILSLVLTPLVRTIARRFGAVAVPKKDRWHRKPTAMMGGIAIYVAAVATLLAFVEHTRESWIVLAASTALFIVGLVDDFVQINPYQKLIGQLVGSAAVIYYGLVLPWTGSAIVNILITAVWLIGITNAVNMLDNMDGLAAGIAAIAGAALAVNFAMNGQTTEALSLGAFAGALLGFLVYNHNPASIFMGDCGSMFIGFFLASTALVASQGGGGRSRSVVAVLAVPVLVLCIPIFDTTFVTLMRKLAGRAASRGGRDHTSHRLVALGMTEKHAVWMLYAFALVSGAVAVLVRHVAFDVSIVTIVGFSIVLTLLGVYLGRVRVYDESEIEAAREKPLVALLIDLSYKRRVFEVLLDALLISLAYYLAYALMFGPVAESGDWILFIKTLPIVVAIKLATFMATGVYRGMWRYASVADLIGFVRSVALSSLLTIMALVFAFRFDGFSRTVLVLDGILLLTMVASSRFAFRLLRRVIPSPHARSGKRVLIYGAGDGGELLYRELHNNATLQYSAVGFIDDDPRKAGKLIHGLRVHHPAASPLADLCKRLGVEEVLLSTGKLDEHQVTRIVGECAAAGIGVTRAYMMYQKITAADAGWVMAPGDIPAPLPLVAHSDANLVHPQQRSVRTDH
ncbi:MAG TPA: glycosyl transferase [Thermoanaerobaculia bacterium]|jgi:UDP-GlcNAc:undecaprenyl-phosphate GlcNAc-1-phosphate transferase